MNPVIVVGLGNPGFEYEHTRHNIGFHVIDELSARLRVRLKKGRGNFVSGVHPMDRRSLVLVRPLTYVNNTGVAVAEVLELYDSTLQELVVVYDDVALPLGTIRVRPKGSHGGHNGIRSIIYQMNSHEFPRIRCGIRQAPTPSGSGPSQRALTNFVLAPFDDDEMEVVHRMVAKAADAAMEFAVSGISKTMNRFNT